MNYNLLIVGDKTVGKSTFIKRHVTGQFERNYLPTNGTSTHTLSFDTNQGPVTFNIFDGGYPAKVDGVIIMFDLTNKQSFSHTIHYYNWLMSMFGQIPVVICGNKVDMPGRKVSSKSISKMLHQTYNNLNFKYFDISSKTNYNFEKPFLFTLRQIVNSESITFIEKEAINPATININNLSVGITC